MTVNDFAQHVSALALRTACVGAALSVAGLLISKPVALGMLLGAAAGFFKLKLSAKALLCFADTGGAARGALVGQRLVNFGFVGAVLLAAFSTPQLNQWAALVGVFLPNAVTVIDTLGRATGGTGEPDVEEGGVGTRMTERT